MNFNYNLNPDKTMDCQADFNQSPDVQNVGYEDEVLEYDHHEAIEINLTDEEKNQPTTENQPLPRRSFVNRVWNQATGQFEWEQKYTLPHFNLFVRETAVYKINEGQRVSPTVNISDKELMLSMNDDGNGDLNEMLEQMFQALNQNNLNQEIMSNLSKIIVYLIAQVASHFQENNIVLFDIKPQNIIIGSQLKPLFIDFEACQILEKQTDQVQIQRKGSPSYWAPEIQNMATTGTHTIQLPFACDIFSLGKTFKNFGIFVEQKDLFDDLVSWMTATDPQTRPTIQDVRNHDFFKGIHDFTLEQYQEWMYELLNF